MRIQKLAISIIIMAFVVCAISLFHMATPDMGTQDSSPLIILLFCLAIIMTTAYAAHCDQEYHIALENELYEGYNDEAVLKPIDYPQDYMESYEEEIYGRYSF